MNRKLLALLGAALVFAYALTGRPTVAHAAGEFDAFQGVWKVSVTPDSQTAHSGGKAFAEAMIFEDGQLMAESFAFYGFSVGLCEQVNGQAGTFRTSMSSGRKGTLVWSGELSNGTIRGSLLWTRPDGTTWTFAFSGRR